MSSGPAKVDVDDLVIALEFASVGEVYGNQAFVSVKTGKIFFKSEDLGIQEDAPADLETSEEFLCMPNKKRFGLGRDLVFSFVEEKLPDRWLDVRDFFRRRGAYARFKHMLESRNMLEAWYRYEETRTREALRRWCEDNGLELAETAK
jgi:hypothetical protein